MTTIKITPLMVSLMSESILRAMMILSITVYYMAPNSTPKMRPLPPLMAMPPSTTAAMAYIS